MNNYCFVIELKDEFISQYAELHRNPWPEIKEAIRLSGIKSEFVYLYKNLSIVQIECEDIDEAYKKLGQFEIVKKWDALVAPWFQNPPERNGKGELVTLECIFSI